ncbi:MAG TPA: hypothetical protein VGN93_01615 [Shinella sp.]|uniref:hypothetical protein n=1 Tax=Shinella sp. TaxID=1870904 RepID=UPI002E15D299|nr:hypothetical protein [Shinella sp.]
MQSSSIDLFQDGDEWVVVLTENGIRTRTAFSVKSHAMNWLNSQRMRLGLPKVVDTEQEGITDE